MEKGNCHILPQDPKLGNKNLFNQATDHFKKRKTGP